MNQEVYVLALTEEFGAYDDFIMVPTQEDFDKAIKVLEEFQDEWWESNDLQPRLEDIYNVFEENGIKYIKCKDFMTFGF